MRKILGNAIAALLLCTVNNGASAWTAIAYTNNYEFVQTYRNATSPKDAQQEALAECEKHAQGCQLFGDPVHGPGAVVVVTGTGHITQAINLDPALAAKNAMDLCTRQSEDCHIVAAIWEEGVTWASAARGTKALHFIYNRNTREEAESAALEGCEKDTTEPGSCKVTASTDEPIWVAFSGINSSQYAAVGPTRAEAVQHAKDACHQALGSNGSCDALQAFENQGALPEPIEFKSLVHQVEQQKASRSPDKRTDRDEYADTCKGANCVRTYKGGRKVQYTACINPATLLPMNDPLNIGGCGGMDMQGNFYGFKPAR